MNKLLWKIIDGVLPPRCLVTGEIVDRQGMLAPKVWADLRFVAPPFCACCGFPFEFLDVHARDAGAGLLCAGCVKRQKPYATARAALVYDDSSREMILRFKHGDQTHAVKTFLPWLQRAGAESLARADMLVPVPLHLFRLIRRRYNQAALLAQALARDSGLAYDPGALIRTRATPVQGRLGYRRRHENVKNAFAVTAAGRRRLAGKSVILVDDVYTTGATIRECARALRDAGAAEIHVLTLARVVRPQTGGE